jgi:Family of unknown function (DUF6313)
MPVAAPYLILYVANGFVNGWLNSYNVNLAITSPGDTRKIDVPLLAWPLSIFGWLVMPVFVGAVVGYAVNFSIERRGAAPIPLSQPNRADQQQETQQVRAMKIKYWGPGAVEMIPSLRDRADTMYYKIPDVFVDYFTALHSWNWESTEDHWERFVQACLNDTDVRSPTDSPQVAMRLAVVNTVRLLSALRYGRDDQVAEPKGYCPYCAGANERASGDQDVEH